MYVWISKVALLYYCMFVSVVMYAPCTKTLGCRHFLLHDRQLEHGIDFQKRHRA